MEHTNKKKKEQKYIDTNLLYRFCRHVHLQPTSSHTASNIKHTFAKARVARRLLLNV